jgi:hypothetical protein
MVKCLFPDPAIASYRHDYPILEADIYRPEKFPGILVGTTIHLTKAPRELTTEIAFAGLLAAHRAKGGLKKRPGSESSGFSPVEKGAQIHSAVP